MGRTIADLRKPLECTYCADGLQRYSDFLFDPRTSVELRKIEVKTLGAYRHHVHHVNDYKHTNFTCVHFFEVYQLTPRGLLIILQTHHMLSISEAVKAALWLVDFPTPTDLKLNGL